MAGHEEYPGTAARCPRAETDAACYVAGDMTPPDAEEYARHIETCAACSGAVAQERELVRLLDWLPARRAASGTLAALSAAALRVAGEHAAGAARADAPWWARLRQWLELPRWTSPRLSPLIGWACAALVVALSVHVLVNRPMTLAPRQADRPDATLIADAEWAESQERALATELSALRRNIDALAVVIASDGP